MVYAQQATCRKHALEEKFMTIKEALASQSVPISGAQKISTNAETLIS